MRRAVPIVTVVAAMLAAPFVSGAAEIGARATAWDAELSGNVKAQSNTVPATKMTFSALGMDTGTTIPGGEVFLRFGETKRHRVALGFFEESFAGQTVLTRDVTFKTITFTASTTVRSRLDISDVDLRYTYDLWQGEWVDGPAAPGAAWFIGGIKTVALEAQLSASGVGEVKEDVTAPIPVLGVGGRWAATRYLGLEAQIAGLAVDVSDVEARFFEASVLARLDFTKHVSLSAGWRTWSLGVDSDSGSTKVDADIELAGPFAMLEARF